MTTPSTTIEELELNITELTGRAVLDDTYKPALAAALATLARERNDRAERGALSAVIDAKRKDAEEVEHARRMDAIRSANDALAKADLAYRAAAQTCALAFRALLTQAAANERTPGAKVEHTLGPDFPHLNEHGFKGQPWSTGQQMAFGRMAWENAMVRSVTTEKAAS